jgi:hypothetical protein
MLGGVFEMFSKDLCEKSVSTTKVVLTAQKPPKIQEAGP